MKIIYNKIIPFGKRYHAINLFGVVFAKGACSPVTVNHEKIHTAQMRELLYVGFYVAYVIEWLIRLASYGNAYMAYKNISFEREAYANERDTAYPASRRRFAFLKYMSNTKYNLK